MNPRLVAYYNDRYITGRFGDPRPGGRIHEGTDFSHSRTPGLTPVPALLGGQVVNIWAPSAGHGYGHRIDINTVEGVVSFAHLYARSPYWMGQRIAQGDIVGYEGTSGFVDGSCCHVEHSVNGRKRDPLPLIRAVLATNNSPAGQEEDDMALTPAQVDALALLPGMNVKLDEIASSVALLGGMNGKLDDIGPGVEAVQRAVAGLTLKAKP